MDFNQFIEEKTNDNNEKKNRIIEKFRDNINFFYQLIDTQWLSEYIPEKISTGLAEHSITEEKLGSYQVQKKWIQIGSYRIDFEPIGTIMIGTDARIDMIYKSSRVLFVHIGENIKSVSDQIEIKIQGRIEKRAVEPGNLVWKCVPARNHSYQTITSDSFQKLIMAVIQNEED